jgi:hypothetical protein
MKWRHQAWLQQALALVRPLLRERVWQVWRLRQVSREWLEQVLQELQELQELLRVWPGLVLAWSLPALQRKALVLPQAS